MYFIFRLVESQHHHDCSFFFFIKTFYYWIHSSLYRRSYEQSWLVPYSINSFLWDFRTWFVICFYLTPSSWRLLHRRSFVVIIRKLHSIFIASLLLWYHSLAVRATIACTKVVCALSLIPIRILSINVTYVFATLFKPQRGYVNVGYRGGWLRFQLEISSILHSF